MSTPSRPEIPGEAGGRGRRSPPRATIQKAVLAWAEVAGRDLPWRRTRDPWAVLVSEVMLAQTQVSRVIPRWDAFLARWPSPDACARAPLGDVIAAWSGLGYNRRAVQLHRAAGVISRCFGGSVPADLADLTSLPGVGAYTGRAVLAFAYEQPVGVVETNTARLLARAVAGRPLSRSEAQTQADRLVPPGRAWAWNQALLDLGATVCTARRPACHACPLGPATSGAAICRWARSPDRDDPARGSAGTSRPQTRFEGSNRQGRGRLLAALAADPGPGGAGEPGARHIPPAALAATAGWPHDPARAFEAALGLVRDGLAELTADGGLRLARSANLSGIRHTDASTRYGVDRLRTPTRG